MSGLRVAYAGTPDLAATILDSLIRDNRYPVSLVYTQPNRPAGRGKKIQQSPVKRMAEKYGIPVEQPESKTEMDKAQRLNDIDVLIVAAFGMLLPRPVLERPRFGCINIHTSLLPRWRGAAPIQYAILAGDEETGISIMQMGTGMDTGDILLQRYCRIQPTDTAGSLEERLAILGGQCILTVLDRIKDNTLTTRKQNEYKVTYSKKIRKADAMIDWSEPAERIERMVRAYNPSPVAFATLNTATIRIWQAKVIEAGLDAMQTPGTVVGFSADGLDVSTGDKVLRILKLQHPGKKILSCHEFYNGNPHFFN